MEHNEWKHLYTFKTISQKVHVALRQSAQQLSFEHVEKSLKQALGAKLPSMGGNILAGKFRRKRDMEKNDGKFSRRYNFLGGDVETTHFTKSTQLCFWRPVLFQDGATEHRLDRCHALPTWHRIWSQPGPVRSSPLHHYKQVVVHKKLTCLCLPPSRCELVLQIILHKKEIRPFDWGYMNGLWK